MVHLFEFSKNLKFRRAFKVLRYLIMAAAIFWMLRLLSLNWQEMGDAAKNLNPSWLLLALILNLMLLLLMAFGWVIAVSFTGEKISLVLGTSIYYQTSLLRYLPGSVWNFPGRGYLVQQRGISIQSFTQSIFVEQFFLISIAAMIASGRLTGIFNISWLPIGVVTGFLILISLLFLSYRLVPVQISNIFKLKSISIYKVILISINYLFVWLLYGLEVLVLLKAFPNITDPTGWDVISSNTAAWLLGFISLAPVGIGVREVSLSALLGSTIGPIAVIASLMQRVIEIIAELGLWILFRFYKP